MRNICSFLFLIVALRLPAATGDLVSFSVLQDGWSAQLAFAGMNTNGTWSFGFGTNNSPAGSEKIKLTVYSPGYDDAGTSNWTARTIYGTKQVRFVYSAAGAQNYAEQVLSNPDYTLGNVTSRVALSEFVAPQDVISNVSVGASLYVSGGGNNASSGLTAANYSVLPSFKVIGNWSWPGFNLVTNTLRLRAVAFHASAEQGRPVRIMKFTAADEHSHTASATVTNLSLDTTLPDAQPTGEYIADLDVSAFTQGDKITCNFQAYPWHGTNVLDTATTGYVWPTSYPARQTNYCDNSGSYGVVKAIVDPVNGNDTTGKAATPAYWTSTGGAPENFLTIGRAMVAIAGTNNALVSRNEMGGGIVYLKAGDYKWLGSTCTIGTGNSTWVHVMPADGVTRSQVVITNMGTDERCTDDNDRVHIYNCSIITPSGASAPFYRANMWLDHCYIASEATAFYQTSTAELEWMLTHCVISNVVQGIKSLAAQQLAIALCRGNTFTNFISTIQVYNMLGNDSINTNANNNQSIVWDEASQSWPVPWWCILYNNTFFGLVKSGGSCFVGPANFTQTNGFVIAQNVFEQTTNNSNSTAFDIGTANSYQFTNGIVWNNVLVGTKSFFGYNDSGSAAAWRYWSVVDNVFDDYNIKSDTFATANAARIGNWPLLFGVGYAGNYDLCTTNIGAWSTFLNDDTTTPNRGTYGINGAGYYISVSANGASTNWPAFVARRAFDGVANAPGGGNYRWQSGSPLATWPSRRVVLKLDAAGNYRGQLDPPGAYATASPRKGAGFF